VEGDPRVEPEDDTTVEPEDDMTVEPEDDMTVEPEDDIRFYVSLSDLIRQSLFWREILKQVQDDTSGRARG